MHFMWFTERAYHYDPEVDPAKYHALENQIVGLRSFFNTPNRFFEREHGPNCSTSISTRRFTPTPS